MNYQLACQIVSGWFSEGPVVKSFVTQRHKHTTEHEYHLDTGRNHMFPYF